MKHVIPFSIFFMLNVAFFSLPLPGVPPTTPQSPEIAIYWELLENQHKDQRAFLSQFIFVNRGESPLPNVGWTFCFTFERDLLLESIPNSVTIQHIAGEYYRLSPTSHFPTLKKGDRFAIPFVSNHFILNASEAPSGGYFVFHGPDGQPHAPAMGAPIQVLPADAEKLKRYPDDNVPVSSPEIRHHENSTLFKLEPESSPWVIPSVNEIKTTGDEIKLSDSFTIVYAKHLEPQARYLQNALKRNYDLELKLSDSSGDKEARRSITLDSPPGGDSDADESYTLEISREKGILMSAPSRRGVFYAIQTLRILLPPPDRDRRARKFTLKTLVIHDKPRFRHRGLHLDAARNFLPKTHLMKLMELMSLYKLNILHFHFSDDEGWRLEIPGLPELTEVGAYRGHTFTEQDRLYPAYGSGPAREAELSYGSGYYSRDDFIEILTYADERNIEIIPEIESPGHARAAIRAMDARYKRLMASGKKTEAEEYLLHDPTDQSNYRSVQSYTDNTMCVCRESAYHFLEKVTDEISAMYTAAGLRLKMLHMGGDEVAEGVWEKSPLCNILKEKNPALASRAELWNHFLNRFMDILAARNITPAGWQEAAGVGKRITPFIWKNVWSWGEEDFAQRLANKGYSVVIAYVTNLYFDLAYAKEWGEPGLYWGGFINTRKPFELTPSDVRKCAERDLNGNPLDPTLLSKIEGLTPEGEKRILGIQGHLWSEHLRSPEMLDYQAFPKLLGLAERAWAAKPDWEITDAADERKEKREKAWNRFANILGQRELPRLDTLPEKPAYRLAPPGAIIDNGFLKANGEFPGLTIRYTLDGSDPSPDSPLWKKPLKLNAHVKIIKLRAFSVTGRGGRISEIRLR